MILVVVFVLLSGVGTLGAVLSPGSPSASAECGTCQGQTVDADADCPLVGSSIADGYFYSNPEVWAKQYTRTTGLSVYSDQFTLPQGEAILAIYNGDEDGNGRVSSAAVFLNGELVFGPAEVSGKVYELVAHVQLAANNSIFVALGGKPGSYVIVTVLTPASLPEPVICAGPEWNWEATAPDAGVYTCKQVATGDWQDYTYTVANVTDSWGNPLPHLAFVVDGATGQLRWSPGGNTTLFMHPGGTGTQWVVDGPTMVWRALEDYNVKLVDIKWEPGPLHPVLGVPMGVASRVDDNPISVRRVAGRSGSMMKWVHDNLSNGYTYGTVGCSGGGFATFSPLYWYDEELNPILDYQYISGAALVWDLEAWCGYKQETGTCEDDPLRECPTNSSYDYTHLIDFQFGEGAPPPLSIVDDTVLGGTGANARVYEELSGPKRWFDDEPYWHCASMWHPLPFPQTMNRVLQGLGILPMP